MAAASSVAFKIIPHTQALEEGASCLVCQDELQVAPDRPLVEPRPEGLLVGEGEDGRKISFKVTVIHSRDYPIEPPLGDQDLVHLSCHPTQVYHHKCIKEWLSRNNSCPLDRRQVDPRPPLVGLSDTDRKMQSWARRMGILPS